MNKKDITASIIIIALLIIGGFLYYRYYRVSAPVTKKESLSSQKMSATQSSESSQSQIAKEHKTGGDTASLGKKNESSSSGGEVSSAVKNKKAGFSSCVVLDEKYCHLAKPIYYTKIKEFPGVEGKLGGVMFGLSSGIPSGANVYAPFDGIVDEGGMPSGRPKKNPADNKYVDSVFVTQIPSSPSYKAEEISFDNVEIDPVLDRKIRKMHYDESSINPPGVKVKKGELIGKIATTTIEIDDMIYKTDSNQRMNKLIIEFVVYNAKKKNSDQGLVPDTHCSDWIKQYFDYIK